jgi:hypothetical protein
VHAIQGHAIETKGDDYGEVEVEVMYREIVKHPRYAVTAPNRSTDDGRKKPPEESDRFRTAELSARVLPKVFVEEIADRRSGGRDDRRCSPQVLNSHSLRAVQSTGKPISAIGRCELASTNARNCFAQLLFVHIF